MINFSVILPVYINENPVYFSDALNSVLSQSYMPSEILIIEDGPLTKELNQCIESYLTRYPSLIKVIKLERNFGMGYAMNIGLLNVVNEWVARVDSDDINSENRFAKQIEYIRQNPDIDVVGSNIEEFKANPGDLGQTRVMPKTHDEIRRYAKFRNPINHMSVMFRRSKAIQSGGYWRKRYFEDYNLWFSMLLNKCKFGNINDTLVYARIGNNMISRRSGKLYFYYEYHFFKKMYRSKFINTNQFAFNIISRFFIRRLPIYLLSQFYFRLLRKRKI